MRDVQQDAELQPEGRTPSCGSLDFATLLARLQAAQAFTDLSTHTVQQAGGARARRRSWHPLQSPPPCRPVRKRAVLLTRGELFSDRMCTRM